jgi:hypothetical protein
MTFLLPQVEYRDAEIFSNVQPSFIHRVYPVAATDEELSLKAREIESIGKRTEMVNEVKNAISACSMLMLILILHNRSESSDRGPGTMRTSPLSLVLNTMTLSSSSFSQKK